MPELKISRTYSDGDILLKTDLDNITEAVEAINNTTKYDDSNIQDQAIQAQHIIDSSVTTSRIAANAISSSKIPDANVTSDKIADNEVKTINIANSAVTTNKLNGSITSAKFNNNERLNSSKIAAKYLGTTTKANATTVAHTDSKTTILSLTTSQSIEYPLIMLQSDGSNPGYIAAWLNSGSALAASVYGLIELHINGVEIAQREFGIGSGDISSTGSPSKRPNIKLPLSTIKFLYNGSIPSGQTIELKISVTKTGTGTGYAEVSPCKLVVLEL
jgi:hypothetical protein